MNNEKLIKDQEITKMLFLIRDEYVILDFDLASLYGYSVKRLNEQVKRNQSRFPDDFMFRITREELDLVKSQIATSRKINIFSGQNGGSRYLPNAFTEQGIYMISTVLKGKIAEQQSIYIMRAFRNMRHFILNNKNLFERIKDIELNQIEYQYKTNKILGVLMNNFLEKKYETQKIFFNGQIYDAYSFISQIIRSAHKSIVLIDNYINIKTLDLLRSKNKNVNVEIFTTQRGNELSQNEIDKFNSQYPLLKIKISNIFHDRFLIIDRKELYHIGASIKDAGIKCFAISLLNDIQCIKSLLSLI